MMENKPRIVINRGVGFSEKSPTPTKLLLNHGKPNFTIVKSPKPKCNSSPEEKAFFGVSDLRPTTALKKLPLKTVHQNGTSNGSPTDDEFMRLHKKIGGRNIDEIINNNSPEPEIKMNGNHFDVAMSKLNTPKSQHFATVQRNCILTVKSVENSNEILVNNESILANGKVALLEKPPTPEKPPNLKTLERNPSIPPTPSPVQQQPKTTYVPQNPQLPQSTNQGGANFEQRTIVSFSRDLSVMPNRYPDTVKVMKTDDNISNGRVLPKEMGELKFKIASNGDVMMPMKKSLA